MITMSNSMQQNDRNDTGAANASDEHIIIIGASHAGVQLAASLREAKFDCAITLISNEAAFPYHRPPLSKAFLKEPELQIQPLRGESYFHDQNITLLQPVNATKIDLENSAIELDNGDRLHYSKLCIATGARPRPLDIEGIDANGIYQLRDIKDAKILRKAARIHKKAVIVGGGFIGLEAAATLHQLGLDVSVIEVTPRLMGRVVAPQISQFVLDRFHALGIKIHLNTPVSKIATINEATSGVLCAEQQFDADMVLIGIGVVPNDELASEAGLETENGIIVDENFNTSAENIYAIGDVANYENWLSKSRIRLESVQNATDQARNLAKTLCGESQTYQAVPWFWSDQADMKIQMVGLSHNSKTIVTRRNSERDSICAFHYDENNALIAIDTINAPGDHMAGRKLIARAISPTFAQAKDEKFRLKTLLS